MPQRRWARPQVNPDELTRETVVLCTVFKRGNRWPKSNDSDPENGKKLAQMYIHVAESVVIQDVGDFRIKLERAE